MKTVLALIDHPNLDIIIGPVLNQLRSKDVIVKALVMDAGKANYLIEHGIPYVTSIDLQKEFFDLPGCKLFLNAADQQFPAHENGRKLDEICRAMGIPSFAIEHASFFTTTNWDPLCVFNADKMAVIGEVDRKAFINLGVPSERLVVTGFPPFDEYFEFKETNDFKIGEYIWIAGQNHFFISDPGFYMRERWVDTLRTLFRVLLTNFPQYCLLVKPHPAEPYHNTIQLYHDAVDSEFASRIEIVDSKFPNVEGISNSAFVVSFSQSVLFESLLLKKKVLGLASEKLSDCFNEAKKYGAVILESTPANLAADISHRLGDYVRVLKESSLNKMNIPEEFIEKYACKFDGKASERIADAVLETMSGEKCVPSIIQKTDKQIRRPILNQIGFERYMRLMGIAEEIPLPAEGTYTLLDIGSHDDAFKSFLERVDYHSYNGFISQKIKGPFEDNSFDIVVATDVLEHVPQEDRKSFLMELLRIAKRKVIFSFPTEQAAEFEQFALSLVPGHQWLIEHAEQGLPKRSDIDTVLDKTGLAYEVKPNHTLASWICAFILDYVNIAANARLKINEFLQEKCFEIEKREPAYRYIYTVNISDDFNKITLAEQESSVGKTIGVLVSIIIPVYNKVEFTRKCIDAIRKNTPSGSYELIIVDNASTDGTKDFLRGLQNDDIKVITNEKNLGFARACNQGARAATGQDLLFLNNDTEAQHGWLEPLIAIVNSDSSVGAVGSKLLFPDKTIQHGGVIIIDNKKTHEPLTAIHNYYQKPDKYPAANIAHTYQVLTAACLLIRRTAFEQAGGFDEGYWNGYEDVDLCFNLHTLGWVLVYEPASVLIHHESQSGPERFTKVHQNIARLLDKWTGRIKPDIIIEADGTVKSINGGNIGPYIRKPAQQSNVSTGVVSIVILTFNQFKYTKECVESIKKRTTEPNEIIFVDNGSTDGTVKWLRGLVKENSHYKLIENKKNLGFAKGCNQGISASSGEYIMLLNNDVVVTDGWLSGMIECLNSASDVGIVGPMTNNISGSQKVEAVGYTSIDSLGDYTKTFRERNRYRRIPIRRVVGFCMLFKRELVDKIGLLDESFGSGNFEDDDFCLRAALEGYRNLIAGDVFIHHYGSITFLGNRIDYGSAMGKNKDIFSKKWSGIDTNSSIGKNLMALKAMEKADELNQTGQLDKAVDHILQEGIRYCPDDRRLYLAIAEILMDAKHFKDALDTINEMPGGNEDIKKLLITGYCKQGMGQDDEAEQYADHALSLDQHSSLALNLKGIIAYKRGKLDAAEAFFKKSIESDNGYGEPYTNLGLIRWDAGEKNDGLDLLEKGAILSPKVTDSINLYHSAITEAGEFERAEKVFRELKPFYPMNKTVSFLLIDSLIKQGKNNAAMQEIENAMVAFGVDDGILGAALEIRNSLGPHETSAYADGKNSVSLCMIVKNEEQHIAKCLMSLKPIVDEIIIVDTGSSDRTKGITTAFGAKVFDFPWTGSFSDARNFSISKASCQWIFVMDADEVISPMDHAAFIDLVKKAKAGKTAYKFVTRNYITRVNIDKWNPNDGRYLREEAGAGWSPSEKVRLFPKSGRILFENPVHELVEPSLKRENIAVLDCKVPVHHYGKLDKEKERSKGEQYFQLGMRKLKENGNNLDAICELAIQAGELEKYDDALELWQKAVSINPDLPVAFMNIGYIYLQKWMYAESLTASKRAIELKPDFWEAISNYSVAELCGGDIKTAISTLEGMLKKNPKYLMAAGILSAAYCCDGMKEKGLDYFEKLKKEQVDFSGLLCSLARQLIAAGRIGYATLLLEAAVESSNINADIPGLLTECYNTAVV